MHEDLITNKWSLVDNRLSFHKPLTKYDKSTNQCLLLTGYSFHLKDKDGEEDREFFAIYDSLDGIEQYSWEYGRGHLEDLGGNRNKDGRTIAEENNAIEIHKKLLQEFSHH